MQLSQLSKAHMTSCIMLIMSLHSYLHQAYWLWQRRDRLKHWKDKGIFGQIFTISPKKYFIFKVRDTLQTPGLSTVVCPKIRLQQLKWLVCFPGKLQVTICCIRTSAGETSLQCNIFSFSSLSFFICSQIYCSKWRRAGCNKLIGVPCLYTTKSRLLAVSNVLINMFL